MVFSVFSGDGFQELLQPVGLWRAEQLVGRALFLDQALVQKDHMVRHICGQFHVMGDQDHRATLVGQAAQELPPPLFPDLYWIWEAYAFLNERRGVGPNGPLPISVGDMNAYAELTGRTEIRYRQQLVRLFGELKSYEAPHYAIGQTPTQWVLLRGWLFQFYSSYFTG